MTKVFNETEQLQRLTSFSVLDKVSCVGIVGGTVASIVAQQAMFATIPLSLVLTLQLFARQKLAQTLFESSQSNVQAIQDVSGALSSLETVTHQTLEEHENRLSEIRQDHNKQNLEAITLKDRIDEQSQSLTDHAGQLDMLETTLRSLKGITATGKFESQSASADSHFTRGTHQEQLGHLQAAIEDYSQAIALSHNYAEAYLRRGLAKHELGLKQSCVIDLNFATKYFFESGDFVNYQKTKDIAAKIHRAEEGPLEAEEGLIKDKSLEVQEIASVNRLFEF